MSKRLSPKEIKQDIRHDELSTTLELVLDWLSIHRKHLIVAGSALVGLLVAGALFATYLDHRRSVAAEDLAAAIRIYEAPIEAENAKPHDAEDPSFATAEERLARSREAFEKITGLGAGAAGEMAQLYLANIAISDGDSARAREIWEKYLRGADDSILAVSMRLNLLRLERQEGGAQKVADELRRELDSPGGSLPEDVVLFELAQTLEKLEQKDEAVDLYQRILDEHPKSPYTARARQVTTAATSVS